MNITKIRLLSNNPKKRVGLIGYGIKKLNYTNTAKKKTRNETTSMRDIKFQLYPPASIQAINLKFRFHMKKYYLLNQF